MGNGNPAIAVSALPGGERVAGLGPGSAEAVIGVAGIATVIAGMAGRDFNLPLLFPLRWLRGCTDGFAVRLMANPGVSAS